jgi:hypothetical protein
MSHNCFDADEPGIFDIATRAAGPRGALPLTGSMLRELPSGDLFGWTQNAGMGWTPSELGGKEFLILSTHGGVRAPDGSPKTCITRFTAGTFVGTPLGLPDPYAAKPGICVVPCQRHLPLRACLPTRVSARDPAQDNLV